MRRTTVADYDDVDGTSLAAETVTFAFKGTTYEIDLCQENVDAITNDIGAWVALARRTGGKRAQKPSVKPSAAKELATKPRKASRAAAIRRWAAEQNPPLEVGTHGRVPEVVAEAFDAAGQSVA